MKNYLERLTGSSWFQGDVGEKSLKNILYSCGLRNPTDFLCQEGDKVIDPEDNEPLRNMSILDVGCGGGLLCEPLKRLGANVTGIDASKNNIEIAKIHAKEMGLNIN